jgi:hypothetical protein
VLEDDYLATWLIPFSESAITVRTSVAFGNLAGSLTTAATYKKKKIEFGGNCTKRSNFTNSIFFGF